MSVVGKYRYFMHSPAERDSVPVIVDIILVGRTKIITLHSSVWLENLTDRRVAFRLHVPITPLVAPAPARGAAPEQQAELKSDTLLGPLPPGEGVSACITLEPQMHAHCHADTLLPVTQRKGSYCLCSGLD